MLKNLKGILILSTLLFSSYGYSQDSTVIRDFEMWTGIGLKKSFLDKKLNVGLRQEFRFEDNSSSINNYFTQLEARYELIDGLRLGGGFRFIRNNRNSGYRNERRFFADLNYKRKLDNITVSSRFRFQNQSAMGDVVDDDVMNKMRLKFKVAYNIKNWKLDPYFAFEGFMAMTTNNINYVPTITEVEKVSGLEKLRFTVGTSYKLNDKMKLSGFYRIENELASFPLHYNTPRTYFIGGLNLTFKL